MAAIPELNILTQYHSIINCLLEKDGGIFSIYPSYLVKVLAESKTRTHARTHANLSLADFGMMLSSAKVESSLQLESLLQARPHPVTGQRALYHVTINTYNRSEGWFGYMLRYCETMRMSVCACAREAVRG